MGPLWARLALRCVTAPKSKDALPHLRVKMRYRTIGIDPRYRTIGYRPALPHLGVEYRVTAPRSRVPRYRTSEASGPCYRTSEASGPCYCPAGMTVGLLPGRHDCWSTARPASCKVYTARPASCRVYTARPASTLVYLPGRHQL